MFAFHSGPFTSWLVFVPVPRRRAAVASLRKNVYSRREIDAYTSRWTIASRYDDECLPDIVKENVAAPMITHDVTDAVRGVYGPPDYEPTLRFLSTYELLENVRRRVDDDAAPARSNAEEFSY